jgi:hypothetical protein
MIMKKTLAATALAVLVLLATAQARAERIVVPPSDPARPVKLEIELINGGVTIEGWDGKEVVIEASAAERLDDDDDDEDEDEPDTPTPPGMKRLDNRSLGLEVVEEKNVVTISTESYRVPIQLAIKVPRRANLAISTVNDGDISVAGVEGDLELQNVNGSITADRISGSVLANTVNGDVRVRLSRGSDKPMAFTSLNGDVEVSLPAGFRADVTLRSDNGEIFSELDLVTDKNPPKVEEQHDGKRFRVSIDPSIRGTLGGGGPELRLQTVNGDILLKKAG